VAAGTLQPRTMLYSGSTPPMPSAQVPSPAPGMRKHLQCIVCQSVEAVLEQVKTSCALNRKVGTTGGSPRPVINARHCAQQRGPCAEPRGHAQQLTHPAAARSSAQAQASEVCLGNPIAPLLPATWCEENAMWVPCRQASWASSTCSTC
jgi:hypothetical protein